MQPVIPCSLSNGAFESNYPADFMAALLIRVRDNIADVSKHIDECVRMGLNVLGPDANESMHDLPSTKGRHPLGMDGIKGKGYGARRHCARKKTGGRSKHLRLYRTYQFKFCNKKVLESLVYAGARLFPT